MTTGTSDPATFVQIQILSGSRQNKELSFSAPERLRFGRNPEAEVYFDNEDSVVSKGHAELVYRDGQYSLIDTGSRFGTFLLARDDQVNQLPLPQPREDRLSELVLPIGSRAAIQLGVQGPICRLMVGRCVPLGRYLLTGRLGQGGMGEVYQAWETELSRFAVVKLIRHGVLKDIRDAEQMLRDEARLVAQLDNSHGARVYEVNKEQGVLYIAMEYLRGVTLADLCMHMKRLRLRLPHDLCCALIRQACLGLHAAHELHDSQGHRLQVVHRDVSSNNVMCTLEGDVKVIDFGVARAHNRATQGLPGERKVVGNPAYMSPEHVEAPQSVDQRSDVFSAAVILYELCTGERLFLRDSVEATLATVCACQVPPLRQRCPEAPDSLVQAIHRALSRSPADRPRTALEFARQLQQVEAESGGRFSLRETIAAYLISINVPLGGRLSVPLTRAPDALISGELAEQKRRPPLPPHSSLLCRDRTIAADRYRLLQRLSSETAVLPAHWKLLFLAEKLAAPGEKVAICVCGGAEGPYALPEKEATRLFEFAERRRGLPPDGHLPPVLDHGLCWKAGPSYLTMPYLPHSLATLLDVPLLAEEKVRLGRQLFSALDQAIRTEPGYVHGDLCPEQIALIQIEREARHVVLLGFDLHQALGLLPPETATEPGQDLSRPYLSPQRHSGGPPTAAGDVYSMGMILYRLCGGDVRHAAQRAYHGQPPPPLPAMHNTGLPQDFMQALLDALQIDPTARPDAADLHRRLLGRPQSPLGTATELRLPLAQGDPYRGRTPAHAPLSVSYLELAPWDSREPVVLPLPVPAVSAAQPEPLLLFLANQVLEMRLSPEARAAGKVDLYRDEPCSDSRCQRYVFPATAEAADFYVGYHRSHYQKVSYAATLRKGEAPDDLRLLFPGLGLRVVAPPEAQRLVAMYTTDPGSGTVHMACVAVRSL